MSTLLHRQRRRRHGLSQVHEATMGVAGPESLPNREIAAPHSAVDTTSPDLGVGAVLAAVDIAEERKKLDDGGARKLFKKKPKK